MSLLNSDKEFEIVWQAIPGTSQEIALDSPGNETLYAGSRGPGKSEVQLARFRRFVGMGYGTFWRGVIFDREYKNLDDLVTKSKRLYRKFNDGARFLEAGKDYKWVWPTGEELLFRAVKKDGDYWNFHGQEFPFIGWNELTKYPTPDLYNKMLSCNRSSFVSDSLPPIPLEIFSTTNSKGPGRIWVKKQFIDPVPYGKIQYIEQEVFNPQTKNKEIITRKRVAIFGSYKENIYLDPLYIAGLQIACENDDNARKSWLEGSWDISEGGMFEDIWNSKIHIVDRFVIPTNWRIDRSFDWGSTHPFAVCWWAEANGEEVELPSGKKWAPERGTLFQISELYGSRPEDIGLNRGIGLSPTEIAERIIEHEKKLLEQGWINSQPSPGPADNQIGNKITVEDDTIEKKMIKLGIRWTKSDKTSGSRKIGLQLFRDRLKSSIKGEGPGVYFFRNCKATLQLIPCLPRDESDPDDIDTASEDHIWDAIRYRILKGNDRYASNLKISLFQ